MSKFRKHSKDKSITLSTAALPDIVFMLLFFFMVGAQMVSENYQKFIELERPVSSYLDVIKEDQISYFYVGKAKQGVKTLDPGTHLILANDKPISLDQIPEYVEKSRGDAGAYADQLLAQLTMDVRTTALFETQILKKLAKAQQLDVVFAGIEGEYGKAKK